MRRPAPPLPVAALTLSVAVLPAVGQTRPASRPAATLAEQQAAERASMLKDLAGRPALPPAPVADVARLCRDGEHLRVLTKLSPTPGQFRIDVTDLTGLCTVNDSPVRHNGVAPAVKPPPTTRGVVPDLFLFDWYQFDRPGFTVVCTTVEVLPTNVQLSRMSETPDDGGSQVLLIEQRYPGAWGEHRDDAVVRLKVTDQGGNGRPPTPDQEWTAESYAALCRNHPEAVARYLEPILRDLHADADMLTPDTALVYQVFAAEVSADRPTVDKVHKLVEQLDADDFHDRDGASRALQAMGPVAAVVVGRMDVSDLSPEQRSRTAALLRQFRPVTDADAKRLRSDVDFLLNCLNNPDPFVGRTALAHLRDVTRQNVTLDPSLQGQRRREAVWALRQRLTTTRPVGGS